MTNINFGGCEISLKVILEVTEFGNDTEKLLIIISFSSRKMMWDQ